MDKLIFAGLLVSVIYTHAGISHHYYASRNGNNKTVACNWSVLIVCNGSLIDIEEVHVVNGSCTDQCPCGDGGSTTTSNSSFTIPEFIRHECQNKTSCNRPLPHPGTSQQKEMTNVTVYYNCTDIHNIITSATTNMVIMASAASFSTTPTSISLATSTTVGTGGMGDQTSQGDPDAKKPSSSHTVISVVVPLVVLFCVVLTLVTIVIIARRKRKALHVGVNTVIRSEYNEDLPQDVVCPEVSTSISVNAFRHSRTADGDGEYNTINLRTFTITDGPTYNHVNVPFDDPPYGRPNVSPLIDSDYAACADECESASGKDTYSHITSKENNEFHTYQGMTIKSGRSEYNHIDLDKLNESHSDEPKDDDNAYSHIGNTSVDGKTLANIGPSGDDYSHIGHVIRDAIADCLTTEQRELKVESESNQNRKVNDLVESQGLKDGNIENHPLYKITANDSSSGNDPFYYTLEKAPNNST